MAEKKTTKTTEVKVSKAAKEPKAVKKPAAAKVVKAEKKAPVAKEAKEAVVVVADKPEVKEKKVAKVGSTLTVAVYDTKGKEIESISLPQAIFGAKVNKTLMAQAVRVYLANQRQGNASTKTRGEVTGSTRKIYRQKGTGRARHGGVRAPIFVHGGIAHGPKPQDHSLTMPKKMRRASLFSALSAQKDTMKVVSGLESLEPKTKFMVQALKNFGFSNEKSKILLVMPEADEVVVRAGRNIQGVQLMTASQLNTYEVLNAKHIVMMKESVEKIKEVFGKKE